MLKEKAPQSIMAWKKLAYESPERQDKVIFLQSMLAKFISYVAL
uniref:Uncharacterized protein n=1 Tax=Anguilla anguilla TaxID=7936 RepID=A0A0E9PE93_ANGAN